MTAENNGTGETPDQGDDPFAHLYRQEGGNGSTVPQSGAQRGVPRRSYNQVRTVGERQYGGQQAAYGQQQSAYGQQQPSAHYAAPETVPGGRAATRQSQHHAGGNGHGNGGGHGDGGYGRGGRSRNGLLIGAIAVVAAVVIGIGAAIVFNSDDESTGDQAGGSTPSASADGGGQGEQDEADDGKQQQNSGLPQQDAASLRLEGGAAPAKDTKGAEADGGTYVAGFNQVGAKAVWTVKAPKAGDYRLYVRYGIPGEDANATVSVNGKANAQPLGMKNFIGSPKGNWEKGWQTTWAPVTLTKGENTVEIACAEGNQCNAYLDQVSLKQS
ncbi:carbohydrate-binding protein [Streptomyces sp. NPDC054796]